MKLSQRKTKPSVCSVLTFSEEELIEALKNYAYVNGYDLKENIKYTFWYSDGRGWNGEKTISLVSEIDGEIMAINYERVKK